MIKAGIVGGTGYTGVELIRLLARHPDVTLHALTSRTEAGKRADHLFPSLRGVTDITFSSGQDDLLKTCDVVFFATPHGVAMQQSADLLAHNCRIIDLAADYRLQDTSVFEKWYGMAHQAPDLLKESVYGLPEINREAIRAARIVGNPGCYPTTVQLGLYPLLKQDTDLIDASRIIVDAKSGVSGAGRKAETSLLFSEASDNLRAYGVAGHRHHPEIVQGLQRMGMQRAGLEKLVFVPHLVPMIRGMLATIHVELTTAGQQTDLQALFENTYASEPFVDVMPAGSSPDTRSTRGSNMLRLALQRIGEDRLVILAAQDNLVKGAAGQAVQNMNLMFGLSETTGLDIVPLMP